MTETMADVLAWCLVLALAWSLGRAIIAAVRQLSRVQNVWLCRRRQNVCAGARTEAPPRTSGGGSWNAMVTSKKADLTREDDERCELVDQLPQRAESASNGNV
jgi:hypothetical protein